MNGFINVLNDSNINDYLDIETFPKNYYNLKIQAKTDFLRLKLLHKYGGYLDGRKYYYKFKR